MKLPASFRYTTDEEEEALSNAIGAAVNAQLEDLLDQHVGVSPVSLLAILVRYMAHYTLQAPDEIRSSLMTASVTTYFKLCGGGVYEAAEDETPEKGSMN